MAPTARLDHIIKTTTHRAARNLSEVRGRMSIGVATGVMGPSWPVNRPGTARSRNSAQCKPGASFALLYATALLGPLDRRRGRGAAGQGLIARSEEHTSEL